jgi:hypothetical protein
MTPHTITITGSDTSKIVLEDVLFGEVRMSPMESDSVRTLTPRHWDYKLCSMATDAASATYSDAAIATYSSSCSGPELAR